MVHDKKRSTRSAACAPARQQVERTEVTTPPHLAPASAQPIRFITLCESILFTIFSALRHHAGLRPRRGGSTAIRSPARCAWWSAFIGSGRAVHLSWTPTSSASSRSWSTPARSWCCSCSSSCCSTSKRRRVSSTPGVFSAAALVVLAGGLLSAWCSGDPRFEAGNEVPPSPESNAAADPARRQAHRRASFHHLRFHCPGHRPAPARRHRRRGGAEQTRTPPEPTAPSFRPCDLPPPLNLNHFLFVSGILFAIGLGGRARPAQHHHHLHVPGADAQRGQPDPGRLLPLQPATACRTTTARSSLFFIITVAAAEVAVGLAIIVALFPRPRDIDVDADHSMKN
jgi:NADH-quinone oxidoreductase subunit K